MEIVNQTIRIIDYENNAVYKRDTPDRKQIILFMIPTNLLKYRIMEHVHIIMTF